MSWIQSFIGVVCCPNCFEKYDKVNVFPCRHEFCNRCANKMMNSAEATCKTCLRKCHPDEVYKHPHLEEFFSLKEDSLTDLSIADKCEICDEHSMMRATKYCLDCKQNMCDKCARGHLRSTICENHYILDKTEKEKLIRNNEPVIESNECLFREESYPEQLQGPFYQQVEALAKMDKVLADHELQIQNLKSVNYTGELIWKITDYRHRKQQAITGQVVSLYSQPFYTDCYGYKMCAKVYLNGVGIGKGTHLSLFFVVMQGDYDEILKWPFTQRISFMLLDTKTHQRHLIDSFKPDKTSSSFHKPTSAMNTASGCPLFVSHANLESKDEMYLRNNVCYLKILVGKELS